MPLENLSQHRIERYNIWPGIFSKRLAQKPTTDKHAEEEKPR